MHEWLFNSSGALLYFKLVFTCRRQVCAQINNYYNTYNTVLCIMLCIDNKITIRYYLPEHMCIMYIILTLYFFWCLVQESALIESLGLSVCLSVCVCVSVTFFEMLKIFYVWRNFYLWKYFNIYYLRKYFEISTSKKYFEISTSKKIWFYCSIVLLLFTSENFWNFFEFFFWKFFEFFFYKNYFITSENISTFITLEKLQNAITNWMEVVLCSETPRKWVKIPF